MQGEIGKLLRLQELDAEAHKLRTELERYPALRKARAEEMIRARKRLEDTRGKRLEIEKRIRETERGVAKWREDLQKFSDQQTRVKHQKEYDALTHEIAETEQKISDADEKGLDLIAEEDRLDAEIAELEKNLEQRAAESEKETARLDEREGEKKRLLAGFLEERGKEALLVEQDLLKRYERLRDQYPTNAIVPVLDGNCGGCFMRVLPRTLQDLQRDENLAACASCHRFLYIP